MPRHTHRPRPQPQLQAQPQPQPQPQTPSPNPRPCPTRPTRRQELLASPRLDPPGRGSKPSTPPVQAPAAKRSLQIELLSLNNSSGILQVLHSPSTLAQPPPSPSPYPAGSMHLVLGPMFAGARCLPARPARTAAPAGLPRRPWQTASAAAPARQARQPRAPPRRHLSRRRRPHHRAAPCPAGKSTRLLELARDEATRRRRTVALVKSSKDVRYVAGSMSTHDGVNTRCFVAGTLEEFRQQVGQGQGRGEGSGVGLRAARCCAACGAAGAVAAVRRRVLPAPAACACAHPDAGLTPPPRSPRRPARRWATRGG
jgi:hypothetical protein